MNSISEKSTKDQEMLYTIKMHELVIYINPMKTIGVVVIEVLIVVVVMCIVMIMVMI